MACCMRTISSICCVFHPDIPSVPAAPSSLVLPSSPHGGGLLIRAATSPGASQSVAQPTLNYQQAMEMLTSGAVFLKYPSHQAGGFRSALFGNPSPDRKFVFYHKEAPGSMG